MISRMILIGVLCGTAGAQETASYARLSGTVTDPAGRAVEGAQVSARRVETNATSEARTDRAGGFRFAYLKIGPYEIAVREPGFAPAVRRMTLTVGSAFDIAVPLAIESQETSVTVSDERQAVENSRSQVAARVSQREIAGLPLDGRNFVDLALLAPGVSPANTGSNQLFPETSAVPGQGISVGSQRNFSNSFIVDGLSANDDAAGLSGAFFGLDVVSEFQVVTSGSSAEPGRALGGHIDIITKSGTNRLHGDLYGYFRNQRLNAANPLSGARLPATQAQYGASVGGPIVRDRTFYFVNFERGDLNQSGLVTVAPASVEAINARLAQTGYRGTPLATGPYPDPVHGSNVFAKLDHRLGKADQVTVRYSLYDVHSRDSRGAGGLSAASASAGLDNTDHAFAASNILPLSSRTVNETRAQVVWSGLSAEPTDPAGPAVSISGVAYFGRLSNSPTGRRNRLYEAVDTISHQAGRHMVKFGANVLDNDLTIVFPRASAGSYSFSSLSNFLNGVYINSGFTQTFGNASVRQTNPNAAVFAEDEWKPFTGLTLTAGVRYDLQFLNTISTDTNNVAPRAGFAWAPEGSRRTVVRGSFGLFYDRIPLRPLANALLSAGNTDVVTASSQINVALSPGQTGAPAFPSVLYGMPAGVLANLTTMDPHIQNAYSMEGSLEIEREIAGGAAISVGYEHMRGRHLIASVNQNVPECAASGNNNGCRPNPAYANNSRYSGAGDSVYDGAHVALKGAAGKWGSYRASYTYSKAYTDVGEFFFSSPIDPFNIWRDWGRSDDDQRHRVALEGIVHAHGFQVSAILRYYSALPLNIVTGANTIQGSAARPVVNGNFTARNAGTGPDYCSISARISRVFAIGARARLESIAEGFNLLNRRNALTMNGTFGAGAYPGNPAASFGQVTAVNDPRAAQLAVRLSF